MAVIKVVENKDKAQEQGNKKTVVRKTVLNYLGYTAIVKKKEDGHFVAEVKNFPGKFYIHASSMQEIKQLFHQFADLYERRKRQKSTDRYDS